MRDDDQMKIRLPSDLKEWVKKNADHYRRTLNSEVVFRLEQIYRIECEKAQQAATCQALDVNPRIV